MQTTFIEENLNHQQILNLCNLIDSKACQSLEFRRCTISDSDFDELIKSLSNNGRMILSLIFNVQMIHEQIRYKKFLQMLSKCSTLLNLQLHDNNITDDMFAQLYLVLYEHCPKLNLLDIGDNKLTNKSMTNLCSLIVPDEKRKGLEELTLSANRLITNAGWIELFFSISFNSRIRRLALDYNVLDNSITAMLSMIIASSQTLTHLDLECCNLTEYGGQLFLTLFTKYPVKLEEIYLDKNPSILDTTRTLIIECLGLKSRQNSISIEQPLSHRLSINDDSVSTNSTIGDKVYPIKMKKKKKKSNLKESPKILINNESKSVEFNPRRIPEKPIEIKKVEEEEEIEELLPIEMEPYGTVGRTLYWNRV